jgi:hypothetical protein
VDGGQKSRYRHLVEEIVMLHRLGNVIWIVAILICLALTPIFYAAFRDGSAAAGFLVVLIVAGPILGTGYAARYILS